MPSYFASIGIGAEAEAEFQDLLQRLEPVYALPFENGQYLRWSCDAGAELWLQVDPEPNLGNVVPYFNGKSVLNATLTEPVKTRVDTPFEGGMLAEVPNEAVAASSDSEGEGSPILFQLLDTGRYGPLALPFESPIELVAFPNEALDVYASEEAFYDQQPELSGIEGFEMKIGADFFSPYALANEPPGPLAVLAGRVRETAERTNPLTGGRFHWVLVDTNVGSIDVVSAPELVPEPIKVDGVIWGDFLLRGRILEPQQRPQRKGWLDRLLGR